MARAHCVGYIMLSISGMQRFKISISLEASWKGISNSKTMKDKKDLIYLNYNQFDIIGITVNTNIFLKLLLI